MEEQPVFRRFKTVKCNKMKANWLATKINTPGEELNYQLLAKRTTQLHSVSADYYANSALGLIAALCVQCTFRSL